MKSRTVLAVLLPMAALFLLCTPFDLTLAGFFYAPSLFPARLLAALGDCPLYLALCALGWMLYFRLPERWKWTALPLVLLGAAAGGWRYAVHAAEGGFPLWLFPLVGVSEGLLPLFPAYRLRKRRGEGDVALLLCLLAALLLSLLLTHGVLKPLCGRMRYRDMAATGDFSGYTPWYRFHPFRQNGQTYKSFPSGHVGAGAAVFLLYLLPWVLGGCTVRERVFLASFPPLYVLALGLGRMLSGAHFATDVLAGAILTFCCIALCVGIWDRMSARTGKKRKDQTL